MMSSFYEKIVRIVFRTKKYNKNPKAYQKRHLLLEPLEDRQLLSVTSVTYSNIYTVDTLDDVVSAVDNQTSLREAIQFANTSAGRDLISFAPGLVGVITINGQLNITDDVDIIGYGSD
ncbi:MAG: hypothetical protein LBJ67_00580, partial [Planctomycetaceae bacterium]|nr:hypothetical protein [Planctomycetaceae bacterium]